MVTYQRQRAAHTLCAPDGQILVAWIIPQLWQIALPGLCPNHGWLCAAIDAIEQLP